MIALISDTVDDEEDDEREVYYVSYVDHKSQEPSPSADQKPVKPTKMKQRARKRGQTIKQTIDHAPLFDPSGRGNNILIFEGHRYIKNNKHHDKVYWKCTKWHTGCKARAITTLTDESGCVLKNSHNHGILDLIKESIDCNVDF
jgi:hypothetical protein